MSEEFPRKIYKDTPITFSVDNYGLYTITITARCKSKKQIGSNLDEDLRVEIDDLKFREIPPKDKPQYINIPSTWNGSQLKDLSKTIVFILKLNKGEHTLRFIPSHGAVIERYAVEPVKNPQKIFFDVHQQAQNGDRRPWYTFVLVDLSLVSISADISIAWHLLDGDDVKLITDGKIKQNNHSILHRYWIWAATPLTLLKGREREEKLFVENLPSGTHYIEFWADKTPSLHTVTLNLGVVEFKRIPTVDDPKWTGDFTDDSDQILLARLILGEMGGESRRAKIGAAFTVVNRLKKQRSNWGFSIKEIILKPHQYDAIWNPITSSKIKDPLNFVSKDLWQECYEIAGLVLSKKTPDPTSGATHFFSSTTGTDFPSWATDDVFKVKIGITYFYELER